MKSTISFVLMAFLILLGSAKSDSFKAVYTQTSIRSDGNSEDHKLARDRFRELIEINTTD